jgi:hypothetical protein
MIQFETYIFPELFDPNDTANDINKDVDGKGTNERFNEAIGKAIDEDIMPYIDNLIPNIYNPDLCLDRYVVFLESMLGFNKELNALYVSSDLATRRKVLRKILKLYQIKGTTRAYYILFSWLGLTAVITETDNTFGFDSSRTLDDPTRRFDLKCSGCSDYTIALTGAAAISDDLTAGIESIIAWNNPINARLTLVTYNGANIDTDRSDYNSDYNEDY